MSSLVKKLKYNGKEYDASYEPNKDLSLSYAERMKLQVAKNRASVSAQAQQSISGLDAAKKMGNGQHASKGGTTWSGKEWTDAYQSANQWARTEAPDPSKMSFKELEDMRRTLGNSVGGQYAIQNSNKGLSRDSALSDYKKSVDSYWKKLGDQKAVDLGYGTKGTIAGYGAKTVAPPKAISVSDRIKGGGTTGSGSTGVINSGGAVSGGEQWGPFQNEGQASEAAQEAALGGAPASVVQRIAEADPTVFEEMQKYLDPNSITNKRLMSQAASAAAARGLGNSTIASQIAYGAMVDRAGDLGKADATIKGNTLAARIAADADLTKQGMANSSAELIAGLDNTSREGIAASANQVERERIESQENISLAEIEAANKREQLRLDNQVLIQNLDTASRERIKGLEIQASNDQQNQTAINTAWDQLQTGIAQIDPKASSASQTTQFNRLLDVYESRIEFIQTLELEGAGHGQLPDVLSEPPSTTIPNFPPTGRGR